MSRSDVMSSSAGRLRLAVLVLGLISVLGAAVVVAQSQEQETDPVEEEDFGAGDFSAPGADEEEEAPRPIDLGNSGGGGAITPEQAAGGVIRRTDAEGDDADGEDADTGGDGGVFVPSEEIRVDTAIAFPVDI